MILALPQNADAQCGINLIYGCSAGTETAHNAVEWHNGTAGGNLHAECLYCISSGGCHSCNPEFAAAEAAMNDGDLQTLRSIAARAPDVISVNLQRQTLALRSCDGHTIIGNVAVTSDEATDFARIQAWARERQAKVANALVSSLE